MSKEEKNQDAEWSDTVNTLDSRKRRKIHLNDSECFHLAASEHGSASLRNPATVPKSSLDPNRGLYPKQPSLGGFQRASLQLNPERQFTLSQSIPQKQNGNRPQSNSASPLRNGSMDKYLQKSSASIWASKNDSLATSTQPQNCETIESNHDIFPTTSSQENTESSGSQSGLYQKLARRCVEKGLSETKKMTSKKRGKRKEKSKPAPKFNRDNPFLYSGAPVCAASSGSSKITGANTLDDCMNISDDEDEDYFSLLPDEVLSNIFCRLPMMDLALNVSRVCTLWHEAIMDPKFVPWKKMYHKLLKDDEESLKRMIALMKENKIQGVENYLPGLIRYISTYKPATGHKIAEILKRHHLYEPSADLLRERLGDCVKKEWPEFYDWFAAQQPENDQTEMHYRVYYALYLYENESSATCSQLKNTFLHQKGQQSMLKYSTQDTSVKMTHEQLRICNHDLKPSETIKIIAFAGTGKTTTLVKFTQLHPNMKFLLVVYNKSVSDQAKKRFPNNVTCMTGHALAFKYVGRRFAAKNQLGNLKVNDIVQNIQKRKGESMYVQAKFVLDTLNNFMASDNDCITSDHVPNERLEDDGKRHVIDHDTKMKLTEDSEKLWNIMKNVNDTKIKMPHDGYLKLYQLQKPNLRDFNALLIDEAQDLTPCIADILLRQKQPKILVGDPHQQIYSFRGAVNAMQHITETKTFYLTQSFRFGPEISFVAATCLEFFKGEKKKILVGNGTSGSISGDTTGQVAIICRSNATLFAEAVKKCCYNNENIRVAFAGGVEAFGFDMILDIQKLILPEDERRKCSPIKHPLVKCFHSFDELNKYATKTSDNELLGKIKIVKSYNNMLPSLIAKIRSKAINIVENADVVFSTAHKAKGLEFSTVLLTDDYVSVQGTINENVLSQLPNDEINLLYVAVTRAKHRLILSPTLLRLLSFAGENLHQPISSKQLLSGKRKKLRCYITQREFSPHSITLVKKKITLSTRTEIPGGSICPQVVLEDMPSLKHLLGAIKDERDDPTYQPRDRDIPDLDIDVIGGFWE